MAKEQETIEEQKRDPFGELVRDARKNKHLSVKDLAANLNLSPSIIENLEDEKFSDLPPPMFVRGYIRAVSQYLGLDTDALLNAYNQHGFSDPSLTKNTSPDSNKGIKINLSPILALVKWFLILAALSGALWLGFTKWKDAQKAPVKIDTLPLSDSKQQSDIQMSLPVEIDSSINNFSESSSTERLMPVSDTDLNQNTSQVSRLVGSSEVGVVADNSPIKTSNKLPVSDADVLAHTDHVSSQKNKNTSPEFNSTVTDNNADVSALQAVDKKGIFLKPSADAWINVVDASGKVLFSQILKRNQERNLVGKPPYTLSVGNARNVKIEYHGKIFDHTRFINGRNVAKFKLN